MGCIAAGSYASALLNIAVQEKRLQEYKEQLKGVKETISSSESLRRVMEYPWISKEDKKRILGRVFGCHRYIMNMLYLLVDKNRMGCLKDVCSIFIERANELLNIEVAEITSAYPLTEVELESIRCLLEKKRKRTIELKQIIDPSCIAGIKLKIKDMVMENTAAGRLEAMRLLAAKADIQGRPGEEHEAEA